MGICAADAAEQRLKRFHGCCIVEHDIAALDSVMLFITIVYVAAVVYGAVGQI